MKMGLQGIWYNGSSGSIHADVVFACVVGDTECCIALRVASHLCQRRSITPIGIVQGVE